MTYSATYSPEDNKLRLYASKRLDSETYTRVKNAGFKWAPKQDLFVAPMWTPHREDFLIELAGQIEDEDKSLVERAEERADRFSDYSDSRAQDADRAHAAVHAIADNIPFGQPILVGHHSERRARRDAEKIHTNMRKAVNFWEQSKYWTDRAAGALRHAKYKERPDVRARRIASIEADIRKYRAKFTPVEPRHEIMQSRWDVSGPDSPKVPHVWCAPRGGRGGHWVPVEDLPKLERYYSRWIAHCENRLAYERAMLQESGGTAADKFDLQPGGRVLVRGNEWLVILRVNRSGDKLTSVTTNSPAHVHWCKKWKYGIEEILEYKAPTPEDVAKIKKATKLSPLCNYPGDGFAHLTRQDLEKRYHFIDVIEATDKHGTHRVYMKLKGGGGLDCHNRVGVFITDQKRKDPPSPDTEPETTAFDVQKASPVPRPEPKPANPGDEKFERIKETLRAGVKAVSAPQLFPTPPELARRMANEAGILSGFRVLEPSAGTGNLVRAIINNASGADCVRVTAVEINHDLVKMLQEQRNKTLYANEHNFRVFNRDFLECTPDDLGTYPRILMNPPFANGSDIKHIEHALTFLSPSGRLVAICADGPRQNERLRPLVEAAGGTWEPLPEGTFAESGTGVNTVLIVMDKQPETRTEAPAAQEEPTPSDCWAVSGEEAQATLFEM